MRLNQNIYKVLEKPGTLNSFFMIVLKLQLDAKYLSYKKLIVYISKHIYNSRTVFLSLLYFDYTF